MKDAGYILGDRLDLLVLVLDLALQSLNGCEDRAELRASGRGGGVGPLSDPRSKDCRRTGPWSCFRGCASQCCSWGGGVVRVGVGDAARDSSVIFQSSSSGSSGGEMTAAAVAATAFGSAFAALVAQCCWKLGSKRSPPEFRPGAALELHRGCVPSPS